MPTCLIGLGSNLGNRHEILRRAVELLSRDGRLRLLQVSRWHETKPAGGPAGQSAYLNGAATFKTALVPHALLAVLHETENRLGRRRSGRWAARLLDLDLLLYGTHVERSSSLVVPHPRMAWRRFVLEPAAEIAASWVHPDIGWSVSRLLAHLNTSPFYVAVTGTVGAIQADFSRRIAEACSTDCLFNTRPFGPRAGCHGRGSRAVPFTPAKRLWHPVFGPQRTTAGFHADPSGHELSIGLECLRGRARRLAAGDPRWSRPNQLTVSDFWFNESRAWARGRLLGWQQSLFFEVWRRLVPRVVCPRLVVLLDVSTRQLQRQTRRSGPEIAILKHGRWALEQELRRKDVGPILRLVDPESKTSLEEVVAAIQAMA